ncbi:gliding motility-associated C-terminal domain-containing protein [Mucilaginibacter sp.]|uniref:gliding motility-associated C-terminal domain-containing protein n=1 Tax=Mucilaginibacter sp. TaxID=1882438 RepID=UPI003D113769
MQPIKFKLSILVICILFSVSAYAQSCSGSLGDPVINQNFGSGANPGAPLASGITNMNYTAGNCPDDGFYTIANSITGLGNCHPNTWQDVSSDHTGNPNGYMMIVNASNQPSVFFTQAANGLCPNTTYQFSAYILNLITLAASGPGVSEPNITFSIETSSGQVLATDTTGTILPTRAPTWNFYGIYFTTPANVTDIVVKMTNNAPGGNGNDLILDDIVFRACGPLIQTGFGSTMGQSGQNICEHSNATYTLKAKVFAQNPIYQWQSNYYGAGWVDIAGKTTDSLNIGFVDAKTGIYQYRLGVGNGSNIGAADCRVYSPTLTVTVDSLPVVPAIPPQTFCEGYTLTLTASGGGTYSWTGPNLPATSQNPLIINNVTPANAGTYTVVVTSGNGCPAAPVQVPVSIVPKVVASINNDVSICAGDATQLTASGGLYYKWTPSTGLDHDDIANPVATPLQTTIYNVNVSNNGCSDDSKSVTVTVRQLPVANGGGDKKIFEGQSVKLNGTDKGDEITGFYWTPTTALDNPNSLTPVASPTDNITYTLNVVSQNCGTSTSNVYVRVYKKITIPNTFTPNGDGINDTWNIDALVTYPESFTQIFDRYGQRVYQSQGYSKAWDGTYKGSALPTGTYYYIIDLKNNTPKLSGWVFIIK